MTPITIAEARLARIVDAIKADQDRSFDGRSRDRRYGRLLNWIAATTKNHGAEVALQTTDAAFLRARQMGRVSLALWRQYAEAP